MKQTDMDSNFVNMADHETASEFTDDVTDESDCSCSLSITSVPRCVFEDQDTKVEFEKLFAIFGCGVEFLYLKSFSRVRVTFNTKEEAAAAKLELHNHNFHGLELGVFYVQKRSSTTKDSGSNLLPPPLTKQFLISPPPSPPVGWEPIPEGQPIINYDLLSALASLDPGRPHELHAPCTTQESPGIIIHLCEEDKNQEATLDEGKPFHPLKALPRNVVQTRMPERK